MSKSKLKPLQLESLKVTCMSSDCDNDLHCFKATRAMKDADEVGRCRSCGINLVDWERVHQQDLTDVQYTFEALKHEMIRHHFWHVEIDQKAINYTYCISGISRCNLRGGNHLRVR